MQICSFRRGGTTLFELCASAVPTVCFSFADNQKGFTEELAQREIMIYAGDARERESIVRDIVEGLLNYEQNPDMSCRYALRMKELVDGKGAARVARFLCRKEEKNSRIKAS